MARACCKIGILTLLFLFALPSRAGMIKWRQTISSDVVDTRIQCSLKFKQTGDEAALAVFVEWQFAGEKSLSRTWAEVAPGDEIVCAASFARPSASGWYPVIARLKYADLNRYPFSSVMLQLQAVDSPPPLRFFVKPAALEFSSVGSTKIRAIYAGDSSINVVCRLIAPMEYRVIAPVEGARLSMRPQEEIEIPVTLEAAGALPGSHHAAFLALESEHDGVHEAGIGMIQLSVVHSVSYESAWNFAALGALAICVLLIVMPILRRRKSLASGS